MTSISPFRSPRLQRTIVFLAIVTLALVTTVTLGFGNGSDRASAFSPDGPFACGANDTSASSPGNRQKSPMWNGDMVNPTDGTIGNMYPCLSGVGLTLNLPAGSGSTISGIVKLDDGTGQTIKTADGTTISNVYHLGFKGFTIGSGGSGNTLTATSGMASPYSFSLAPDHGATLGGGDVVTDLWVDGDSQIVLTGYPMNLSLILVTGCSLLGGSGGITGSPCTVAVKNISAGLANFAQNYLGAGTLNIDSMNLKIYYAVTHTTSGGDPSGASFQFPNSTITVGGS